MLGDRKLAGEEIIHVYKWFIFATSIFLLVYFIYEILIGSRAGLFRFLVLLSAIVINYEEFFFAELFLGKEYHFLTLISVMGREPLLESIIGIKVFTILFALLCFMLHRFRVVNEYLDIFILSILVAYGTTAYAFTISTGNYVPGLISSIAFVLPVWLVSIKYSLKRFLSISSLSTIIIFGFLFNALHFVNLFTLFVS